MNHNVRERITAEAASLADRYPVDIAQATDAGTRRLRKRYTMLSIAAILVVVLLSVCVLLWRSASGAPAWGPFAPPASQTATPPSSDDSSPAAVGLRIDPAQVLLAVGSSQSLATFLVLDDGSSVATDQVQVRWTVGWASSDPSVAAVDQDGMVRALRPGSVTIRAIAQEPGGLGFTATSRVTVGRVP
jgi:hypothetical protein